MSRKSSFSKDLLNLLVFGSGPFGSHLYFSERKKGNNQLHHESEQLINKKMDTTKASLLSIACRFKDGGISKYRYYKRLHCFLLNRHFPRVKGGKISRGWKKLQLWINLIKLLVFTIKIRGLSQKFLLETFAILGDSPTIVRLGMAGRSIFFYKRLVWSLNP